MSVRFLVPREASFFLAALVLLVFYALAIGRALPAEPVSKRYTTSIL